MFIPRRSRVDGGPALEDLLDPVGRARVLALLQAVVGVIFAFFGSIALLAAPPHHRYFALLYLVCAVAMATFGVAFLLRRSWARLFLAGMYALMALGFGYLTVTLQLADRSALAFLAFLAFAMTAWAAFTFISPEVRAWCGELLR
ncbi:MAG: hypothetical protein HYY16_03560 [Planctomycetes bacterium]|nr:hypothetical protein [Planctomycetota bacterium]